MTVHRNSIGLGGIVADLQTGIAVAMAGAPFDQRSKSSRAASMAEYKLILDGLSSFGVEIIEPDGFRSVRGFPTEVAALTWIAEQEARQANRCRDLPELNAPELSPGGLPNPIPRQDSPHTHRSH